MNEKEKTQLTVRQYLEERHPELIEEFEFSFDSVYNTLASSYSGDEEEDIVEGAGLLAFSPDAVADSIVAATIIVTASFIFKLAMSITGPIIKKKVISLLDKIERNLIEKGFDEKMVKEIRRNVSKLFLKDKL